MNSGQRIYLLRHGHSEFQTFFEATGSDPGIIDAPLSERGIHQVREIARDVAPLDVDLIVTSPLSRALQTAIGVLAGTPQTRLIVHPLLSERLGDSCDIGRPSSILARAFPSLDFGAVPEHWWYDGPVDPRGIPVESRERFSERIATFRAWLAGREERTILLVGHSGVFKSLCGLRLDNCHLQEWRPPMGIGAGIPRSAQPDVGVSDTG